MLVKNGAQHYNARMNPKKTLIITIDGPAGTGKSSVAAGIARRLGIAHLDTGAMYRAVTWYALKQQADLTDPAGLGKLAAQCHIGICGSGDTVTVNGHDVTAAIRNQDVTAAVHALAGDPAVRAVLVDQQRRIATELGQLVTEGRDQGSEVFPDATVKFYLDATAPCRATRRYDQLKRKGQPADYDQILAGQQLRDQRDQQRKHGPLTVPDDAIIIDTSQMSLEGVIDTLVSHVTFSEEHKV